MLCRCQRLSEAVGQQEAVGQAGQHVMAGQKLDARLFALALGDVGINGDVIYHPSLLIPHQTQNQPFGIHLAVAALVPDFAAPAILLHQLGPHFLVKLRRHAPGGKHTRIFAQHFRFAIAGNALESGVDPHDIVRRIGNHNGFGIIGKHHGRQAQLPFGALALQNFCGQIAHHGVDGLRQMRHFIIPACQRHLSLQIPRSHLFSRLGNPADRAGNPPRRPSPDQGKQHAQRQPDQQNPPLQGFGRGKRGLGILPHHRHPAQTGVIPIAHVMRMPDQIALAVLPSIQQMIGLSRILGHVLPSARCQFGKVGTIALRPGQNQPIAVQQENFQAIVFTAVQGLFGPFPVNVPAQHALRAPFQIRHRGSHIHQVKRLPAGVRQQLGQQQRIMYVADKRLLPPLATPGALGQILAFQILAGADHALALQIADPNPGISIKVMLQAFQHLALFLHRHRPAGECRPAWPPPAFHGSAQTCHDPARRSRPAHAGQKFALDPARFAVGCFPPRNNRVPPTKSAKRPQRHSSSAPPDCGADAGYATNVTCCSPRKANGAAAPLSE